MYTPRSGYGAGDLTWWKGRNVAGAAIGVLQFPANIPMMPGNVGNAGTFDFPVIYHQVNDIDIWALVEGRSSDADLAKIIAGAKALAKHPETGAILLECTELTPFSWAVQEATGLPVFDSITPIKWLHSGVVQRPYYGHI